MARFEPNVGAWLDDVLMSAGVVGKVRQVTSQVEGAYLAAVPRRSGELARSIRAEVVPDPVGGGDRMAGYVYATARQAFLLEYGTSRIPARHLLARAAGSVR